MTFNSGVFLVEVWCTNQDPHPLEVEDKINFHDDDDELLLWYG